MVALCYLRFDSRYRKILPPRWEARKALMQAFCEASVLQLSQKLKELVDTPLPMQVPQPQARGKGSSPPGPGAAVLAMSPWGSLEAPVLLAAMQATAAFEVSTFLVSLALTAALLWKAYLREEFPAPSLEPPIEPIPAPKPDPEPDPAAEAERKAAVRARVLARLDARERAENEAAGTSSAPGSGVGSGSGGLDAEDEDILAGILEESDDDDVDEPQDDVGLSPTKAAKAVLDEAPCDHMRPCLEVCGVMAGY